MFMRIEGLLVGIKKWNFSSILNRVSSFHLCCRNYETISRTEINGKIKAEAPEPDNSALEAAQAELASVKEDLTAAKDAAEANTAKVSDLEKQLEEKNAELEKSNQEVETINAQISGKIFTDDISTSRSSSNETGLIRTVFWEKPLIYLFW